MFELVALAVEKVEEGIVILIVVEPTAVEMAFSCYK